MVFCRLDPVFPCPLPVFYTRTDEVPIKSPIWDGTRKEIGRYMRNDETEEHTMLRLLGILTLGNLIFGGHRCHYHRHLSRRIGRGILLGTLLGLFVSRANQTRTGEEV